jgi:HEAT repeat protein
MYFLWVIPVVILIVGAGLAFIPAYFAVRARRRAAVLEETKVTSIDRLRPGLRKVKGRVIAHDRLLRSPMTRQDCVYFRFVVEEMHTHHHGKHGTSTHWVKIIDDHQSISVSVDDETGHVNVHLGGAEVVMRDQAFNSSGTFNDPPERLRRLMENEYGKSTKGWLFNKTLRYTETVLEDGAIVTVVGEVEQRKGGTLVLRKGAMPLFVSDKGERQLGSHHRNRALMLWIVTGVIGFFTLVGVGVGGIIAAAGTAASRATSSTQAAGTPAPQPDPSPQPAPGPGPEVPKNDIVVQPPPQPRPRPGRVPRPAPKKAPLPDEELTAAVAALKANDFGRTFTAARKLSGAGVTEARRDEVERALWPVIKHFNPQMRGVALRALAVWGTRESVPALRDMLAAPDPFGGHHEVLRVLGRVRHPDASEVLITALDVPQQRRTALEALKEQGPVAEPAVLRLLVKEGQSDRVVELCGILDEIGTRAAVPHLQKLSRDPELKVAQAAVDALEGIKERGNPPPGGAEEAPVVPRPRPKRPKPPEPPPSPEPPTDEQLVLAVDDLRSRDFGRRKRAADLLARSGLDGARQVEVEKALWSLLEDANAGLRVAALAALRVWGTEDSVPALKAALRQEDTRGEALQALGTIRHASASEVLVEALTRPNDRPEAARALKAQGPVAEPAVLRLLGKTADPVLAAAACGVLDEIGTKAALPELQRLARSPDRRVAQAAVDAVEGVRERPDAPRPPRPRPPQRPPVTAAEAEVLRALAGLRSGDFFAIKGSAETLGRTPVFEPRRADVEKALRPLINSDNPFLRGAALGALRTWATKDTLPALKDAVARRVPFSHGAALQALGAIKDVSATELLVEALGNAGDRAAATAGLKAQGPMAEPKVLPLLKSADAGVVTAACDVLGVIGTKASVPELQRVSRLPVPQVAQAAVNALRRLRPGVKIADPPGGPVLGRIEFTRALAGLRSPDFFTRKSSAELFARSAVDPKRRRAVETALQPFLKDPNPFQRKAGLAALGVWGSKDSVPALKAALAARDPFSHGDTLKTLGAIKDEAATDVLIEAYGNAADRGGALAALKAQGPVAEPGVLRLLGKTADAGQAAELCSVLGEIGTRACLAEMERLVRSPEPRLAEAARAAREAVRKRTDGG